MSIAGFFQKKTAAEFQKQVELDAAKSAQTAAQARQSPTRLGAGARGTGGVGEGEGGGGRWGEAGGHPTPHVPEHPPHHAPQNQRHHLHGWGQRGG